MSSIGVLPVIDDDTRGRLTALLEDARLEESPSVATDVGRLGHKIVVLLSSESEGDTALGETLFNRLQELRDSPSSQRITLSPELMIATNERGILETDELLDEFYGAAAEDDSHTLSRLLYNEEGVVRPTLSPFIGPALSFAAESGSVHSFNVLFSLVPDESRDIAFALEKASAAKHAGIIQSILQRSSAVEVLDSGLLSYAFLASSSSPLCVEAFMEHDTVIAQLSLKTLIEGELNCERGSVRDRLVAIREKAMFRESMEGEGSHS